MAWRIAARPSLALQSSDTVCAPTKSVTEVQSETSSDRACVLYFTEHKRCVCICISHENRCTPATRRPLGFQSTSSGDIQRECILRARLSGLRTRLSCPHHRASAAFATCPRCRRCPQCRLLHQLQRANAWLSARGRPSQAER